MSDQQQTEVTVVPKVNTKGKAASGKGDARDNGRATSGKGDARAAVASRNGSHARIPTVHKLAQLLEVFTPAQPRWRLADLARELGWDGATTHRFARALADISMIDLDEDGNYTVGVLPQRLAAVAAGSEPGRHDLLQRLAEIAEQTELTTQVGLLDRGEAVVVASQEGRGALNAAASLGERLPLHATAMGKAMLVQLLSLIHI